MPSQFRLFITIIFAFLSYSPWLDSTANSTPPWYTVQAGSYIVRDDAENLLAKLKKQLPPDLSEGLRIEFISSYYTVRLGKAERQENLAPLLWVVKNITPVPLIVQGIPSQIEAMKQEHAVPLPRPAQPKTATAHQTLTKPEQTPLPSTQKLLPQQPSPLTADPNKLFFTVQLGSYTDERDAVKYFEELSQKLPNGMKNYLRVERISFFFTVRVGKSLNGQDLLPIFQEAKKIGKAELFKAYVRENRIRKLFKENNVDQATEMQVVAVKPQPSIKQEKRPLNTYTPLSSKSSRRIDLTLEYDKKTIKPKPSSGKDMHSSSYMPSKMTASIDKKPQLQDDKRSNSFPTTSTRLRPATLKASSQLSAEATYTGDIQISPQSKKAISTLKPGPSALTTSSGLIKRERLAKRPGQTKQITMLPSHIPVLGAKTIPPEELAKINFKPMDISPPTAPNSPLNTQQARKPVLITPEVNEKTTSIKQKPLPKLDINQLTRELTAKYLEESASIKKKDDKVLTLAKSFKESPDCISAGCHTTLNSQPTGHFPVKSARCTACHTPVQENHPDNDANNPDFELVAEGGDLCKQCHAPFEGSQTHSPVEEGECLSCHSPHGSQFPSLLTAQIDGRQNLCMECHDSSIMENKFQHGPVGIGECRFCHDPHVSNHDSLLKEDPKTLCLSCHKTVAQGLQEAPHVHSIVVTEGCTSCHNPHGSNFPSLLSQKGEVFCLSCHEAIADKYNKSRYKHAGLYLEDQCATCHFAHSSKYKYLLNQSELKLCMSCHSEKSQVSNKKPKNIESELKKSYLHKPVAEGQCSQCHDPHGSKFSDLLVGPYPGTFYAPYDPGIYDLCFKCHAVELLTLRETDYYTKFRNGTTNLHYTHVAIDRKGRTCQACHQAHASNGPKLINRTGASFGAWQMSIEFTTNTKGGSCTPGCHREMAYNREDSTSNTVEAQSYGESFIDYESKN